MTWEEYSEQVKEPQLERPGGIIQWKGTDVCIELHCVCGAHDHYDGEFFDHFKCRKCGRRYKVGKNVILIELTSEQVDFVDAEAGGFKTGNTKESDL